MNRQFQRKYLRAVFWLGVAILADLPSIVSAWSIPGHMLSGAIAYQILRTESPSTIATVKTILAKNPWYETGWKEQLDRLPVPEQEEMLFMLAARWADDVRTQDREHNRAPWHYIHSKQTGNQLAYKQSHHKTSTS